MINFFFTSNHKPLFYRWCRFSLVKLNNYIKVCSKMRFIVRDCKNDHEWASSPDPISNTWRQKTYSHRQTWPFTSCSLFSSCDFKASGFLYLQVLHTHVQASAAFWVYSSQRSQLGGPERCSQTCPGFCLLRLRRPELRKDQIAALWQTWAPSGDSCGSNLVLFLGWISLTVGRSWAPWRFLQLQLFELPLPTAVWLTFQNQTMFIIGF